MSLLVHQNHFAPTSQIFKASQRVGTTTEIGGVTVSIELIEGALQELKSLVENGSFNPAVNTEDKKQVSTILGQVHPSLNDAVGNVAVLFTDLERGKGLRENISTVARDAFFYMVTNANS